MSDLEDLQDAFDHDGAELPTTYLARGMEWRLDLGRATLDATDTETAVDITGWEFVAVLTESRRDLTVVAEFADTIDDATEGEFHLTVPAASATAAAGRHYHLWIWEKEPARDPRPLASGPAAVTDWPEEP